jgi:cell division protein FtsI (penicillin-binding protein 3)
MLTPLPAAASRSPPNAARSGSRAAPVLVIALAVTLAFSAVAAQVLRLSLLGGSSGHRANVAEPLFRAWTRPDIVDRKGRLLAGDLVTHSLFADPAQIIDVDETSEQIASVLRDVDRTELRTSLADRYRRFVWIKRQLGPAEAQRIHDLGLPGLSFRNEPRRIYPQGRMAGHVLGHVSIDNRGMAGIERHIDETQGLESGFSADFSRPPVTLTLDIGAQHALEEELSLAVALYGAAGAAGVVLDANDGSILAAASLPDLDPARPAESLLPNRIDRLNAATYELGSVMKVFTVAMALEQGLATPNTILDVRVPLQVGRWTIRDIVQSGRPLTMREVLIQSSNIGVAQLALRAGPDRQRDFLERAGLLTQIRLETGPLGTPRAPARWGETEAATIAYGYGIAVSPMQFAAAAASLVNGGYRLRPHIVTNLGLQPAEEEPSSSGSSSASRRVVSGKTSSAMRDMLRRVVTQSNGTGRRAEAPGFEVGGKTGTAEMAARGGYQAKSVVSTFLAAFPMSEPRYVVLVSLFEPQPVAGDAAERITAGVNAAPIAGRVIARTAAILGVPPK